MCNQMPSVPLQHHDNEYEHDISLNTTCPLVYIVPLLKPKKSFGLEWLLFVPPETHNKNTIQTRRLTAPKSAHLGVSTLTSNPKSTDQTLKWYANHNTFHCEAPDNTCFKAPYWKMTFEAGHQVMG